MSFALEPQRKSQRPRSRRREIARARTCFFAVVMSAFFPAHRVSPVPASPQLALLHQPDGTAFLARRVGDESRNFTETAEGYTVIRDHDSGFWFYVAQSNGMLRKSSLPVGKASPQSLRLKKHLRPPEWSARKKTLRTDGRTIAPSSSAPRSSAGSITQLVILARFLDHMSYISHNQFDDLFNQPGYSAGGAAGSVRDYYLDVSAGQLTIDSTVPDWVILPRPESFYGANNASGQDSSPRQLVRDAVHALDSAGFDFRPFDADGDGAVDMLTVVHSGLGEEFVGNPPDCAWSQVVDLVPPENVDGVRINRAAIAPERRYDTASITRIGVICHETGHLLGLPDLYDTDGSSSGIGVWGVMGAGSWGGDGYSPERPVHFCCWSKVKLGWIEPTEIEGSGSLVSVTGIEKAGTWGVYKISCEMADGEYLLIENRRKTGYDLALPADGLLIWHVDENEPWNSDESHYMLALLQADGAGDLEGGANLGDPGDPFPGGSNTRNLDDTTSPSTASYYNDSTHIKLSNISDSASTMTFEISTLSNIYGEDFSQGLPPDWEVVDGLSDGYTWTDQNPRHRADPSWSGGFMIVDSDAAGYRSMNERLISPEIDCSLYVHTRLKFTHSFRASAGQTGDVDLRVDGEKWQNLSRYKFDDDSGTKSIDISSLADGRSSVQVRWHFYDIRYGWYWGIDNFAIRGELPDNAPPQIAITSVSQRRDGSGRIEIHFIGTDPENDPASWATSDCQYTASPFTAWQQLEFDTTDPANTAVEPMPFTAHGTSLVAVVDASTWNGFYKLKLRVTDGVTSNPPIISDEFSVDNTSPVTAAPTHLRENPSSGDTSITSQAVWDDSNPDITWFQLRLNDGPWGDPLQGQPNGEPSQAATFASLFLDGDDFLTVKSYHVDAFGNRGPESISPTYYVTPLTPPQPTIASQTPNGLVVIVQPNASEQGDVHYAVYCSTVGEYVDWETGRFLGLPSWGSYTQWGGPAGTVVVGLHSKTLYAFQVVASNPRNHDCRSELSPTGSAITPNNPPHRPASVEISPQQPLTLHDLTCRVTPASPPDADAEDTVFYRFTWSCLGVRSIVHGPKPDLTDILPSENTRKGQTWTCIVDAYDFWDYGPGIRESLVIGNTPPFRVSYLRFVPSTPRTSDAILCLVTPAMVPDADSEDVVTYRYTWTCPGNQQIVHGPTNALSDTLSSSFTTKGDTWRCAVEPYDGTDYGTALESQVAVLNSPPSIVVLGQRAAYAGQSIHLDILSSDADGDPTTILCTSIPPGAVFSQNHERSATFSWSNPSAALRRDIPFSVNDGSEETIETVSLTFSQTPFEIASLEKTAGQGGEPTFIITWYALPGVIYSIYRSPDLLTWEPVAGGISLPEPADVPDWLTYQQQIGGSASSLRYYRLGM